MKKFILLYPLTIILLFVLFYWDVSPLANTLNQWQIELSSWLTSLTLAEGTMQENHIFINRELMLIINKECNGLIPYFFFLASIIAFPATLLHKIKWAIFAYLALLILNVFRIWFITQLVLDNSNNFSLAHDYLGNILLVISSLILFIGFIKTR